MKKKQFLKFGVLLLSVLIVTTLLIGRSYPFFLKWMIGQARMIGKPINAKVFTDGKVNNKVKVFAINSSINGMRSSYFLIDFNNSSKENLKNIICVHRTAKYVGEPVGSSNKDFGYINGFLFQSETGSRFIPYDNNGKRSVSFDTELRDINGQITFKVPDYEERLECDSVRIEL